MTGATELEALSALSEVVPDTWCVRVKLMPMLGHPESWLMVADQLPEHKSCNITGSPSPCTSCLGQRLPLSAPWSLWAFSEALVGTENTR